MRRLPWHVTLRADRKALLTASGVALGVWFCMLSFAVPGGLRTETISAEGPLASQDFVVMASGMAPFRWDEERFPGATAITLLDVEDASVGRLTLVAAEGPRAPNLAAGEARPGIRAPAPEAGYELRATGAVTLTLGEPLDLAFAAPEWIVVPPETISALAPERAGLASYLLVPALSPGEQAQLVEEGFLVARTPAAEPFFRASAVEISRDLTLLVAFCSVLIALLTYEFLRAEVREQRREIALWRGLGMRMEHVLALLLARCGAITAGGAILGGVLALATLAVLAQTTGYALFRGALGGATVALLALAFLGAGMAGGFVPAYAAARGSIHASMEGAP